MEDIAREAGVSMMTVSRVLSGKSNVSDATRAKVLETAQRHDYEVNALAQNFAQKRSGFVGIATPLRLVGTDYFGEIMKGFESVLGDTLWDYALFNMNSSAFDDGNRLLKLYRGRRVDGLLAIAPNMDDKFLDMFASFRFPLVVVGKVVESTQVCCVRCNDYQGIETLCAHLFELGHRRIAFLAGPSEFSVARQREQAYLDFCRNKGLEIPAWFIQRGDYSLRSGRDAGRALQLKSQTRPTAIIAANDAMAIGVMESARECQLRVPDDLSIAGFDDIPMAAESFPALTTIHQPVFEMAARSARLLQVAVSSGRPPVGSITLPVSVVIRGSTAPCS